MIERRACDFCDRLGVRETLQKLYYTPLGKIVIICKDEHACCMIMLQQLEAYVKAGGKL